MKLYTIVCKDCLYEHDVGDVGPLDEFISVMRVNVKKGCRKCGRKNTGIRNKVTA